jgi:hypothetical protein
LDITLETQKFRVRNSLNQELHFCIENTLKNSPTGIWKSKKFSGGFAPAPLGREGKGEGEGWGEEEDIGEGRGQEGEKWEERDGKGREGEGKECGPPVKIP